MNKNDVGNGFRQIRCQLNFNLNNPSEIDLKINCILDKNVMHEKSFVYSMIREIVKERRLAGFHFDI